MPANESDSPLIDVRAAAELAGRHPETVRRWVWSGRLRARRRGGRLLMDRREVEALAGATRAPVTLAEWARRARASLQSSGKAGSGRSAADLVLEDRRRRSDR